MAKNQNEDQLVIEGLMKEAGNEYASFVVDGVEAGDVAGYIDTGSYSLNALLSGSIYGGIPSNKVTALAGESSTGKTFFALNIIKLFLEQNPKAYVFYFESESAISKDMMEDRGIDSTRVIILPVGTIQEFRTQCIKILNKYLEIPKAKRHPIFMVLDSLGNLSTDKEVTDIASGKDTRDMTRAQLIRGAFRALTLKFGKAQIPLLTTNHTYQILNSYVPMRKQGGGDGLVYAASTIIFLSKKKERDEDDKTVTGNIITCKAEKSRLTVEHSKVETLLRYDTGLDRYYGLLELAENAGIFKKLSKQYELPNGEKVFRKAIISSPAKYFTEDVLDKIDEHCRQTFLYGMNHVQDAEEEEVENV